MTEENRPMYVGYGTCRCGRVEVSLYRLPSVPFKEALACAQCVVKAGHAVPRSRTADDIELVDGKLTWRKS